MKIQIYFADEDGVTFKVPSSRKSEGYQYVSWDNEKGWICTCEHYQFRKKYCKHMELSKKFLNELNEKVKNCNVPFSL